MDKQTNVIAECRKEEHAELICSLVNGPQPKAGNDICTNCLMVCFTSGMRSRCCDAPTMNSAIRMFNAIESLRAAEGASITIPCDPPDFGSGKMWISVSDEWTGYEDKEFRAENVLEALEAAVKAKSQ